jgi:hypothetical protein
MPGGIAEIGYTLTESTLKELWEEPDYGDVLCGNWEHWMGVCGIVVHQFSSSD